MPSYTVTVATGSQWFAGTDDYIYLSLIGSAGCSEKHLLDKAFYNDFERGAVRRRAWDPGLTAKSGWWGRAGRGAGAGRVGGDCLVPSRPKGYVSAPGNLMQSRQNRQSRCMSGQVIVE